MISVEINVTVSTKSQRLTPRNLAHGAKIRAEHIFTCVICHKPSDHCRYARCPAFRSRLSSAKPKTKASMTR